MFPLSQESTWHVTRDDGRMFWPPVRASPALFGYLSPALTNQAAIRKRPLAIKRHKEH